MKLCPLIVQGMWEYKSPLLQLPHITEDNLKYFTSKKVIKVEGFCCGSHDFFIFEGIS